ENQSNQWPSIGYRNTRGYGYARDASFVRIKDVRLSYRVPSDFTHKYGISDLMFYVAGRNLYTFTVCIGWDPERKQSYRGTRALTNYYQVFRSDLLGMILLL